MDGGGERPTDPAATTGRAGPSETTSDALPGSGILGPPFALAPRKELSVNHFACGAGPTNWDLSGLFFWETLALRGLVVASVLALALLAWWAIQKL